MVELEAVPAEDWEFSHWEGDLSGSENPAEITIEEPKEIVAVFMTIPTVSTSSVGSITYNSAQSGGEVSNDGGADVTVRGVVWSTNEIPTLSSSSGSTSDGSGMGSFTSDITGLSSSTTYFLRAYATNSVGTGYGEQINFKSNMESEVVEVTNPVTGRTWMDRNLGASHAATSMTDEQAYGDLYQWGRGSDGHHKRNSPTTDT